MKLIDLINKRFGALSVIARHSQDLNGGPVWVCQCDCGKLSNVRGTSLKQGHTRSCGCIARDGVTVRNTRHGMRNTPEYRVWAAMKSRCINPGSQAWRNYGGRGITVCAQWIESFPQFLNDMGEQPSSNHSIDRLNNDGGYAPENCQWVERLTQANNRRTNRIVEVGGKKVTMRQASTLLGISYSLLKSRSKTNIKTDGLAWIGGEAVD